MFHLNNLKEQTINLLVLILVLVICQKKNHLGGNLVFKRFSNLFFQQS